MRLSFLLGLFGFFPLAYLFLFPQLVGAQVIINEVMADPAAASDKSEWVELYNYSAADVDLRGWSLDGKLITSANPITIQTGKYFTIAKTLIDFTTEFGVATNVFELNISLTNSGKTLELSDGLSYKDTITYTAASPNISWERKGRLCADLIKHPTAHSLNLINIGNTAACSGVAVPPVDPPPAPVLPSIQISEVFPSPNKDKQEVEWLELYNFGNTAIDLSGWKLKDTASSHTLTNLVISPHQYLVLTDIGISLNNGGDEVELMNVANTLVDKFVYGKTDSSFAQMRSWDNGKYGSELEMTARSTPGLLNVYQAEPDVEVVTKKEIVTQKVEVPGVCAPQVPPTVTVTPAIVEQYELPSTEIHRLPELPIVPDVKLNLWPLFLLLTMLTGVYIFTDTQVVSRMLSLYRLRKDISQYWSGDNKH